MSGIPDGWYRDPDRGWRLRYFDADGWSPWVATDDERTLAPLVDPNTPPPSGLEVTRFVLQRARAEGVITPLTHQALTDYLVRWERSMSTDAPAAHPPKPATRQRPTATVPTGVWGRAEEPAPWGGREEPPPGADVSATSGAPTHPTPRFIPVSPREPGRAARWWAETVDTVKSDLAVHGLAYLGVLLLFAGVFGLVVWSFGDISRNLRPVAELAIPLSLFVGAAMLRRRGTRVVAGALEVAGGLLLPIVVVAAFVDDAPVPPDPTGSALPVTLFLATLLVAGGYVLWVRLHTTSALAYLVAPVSWLALGFLSLTFSDDVPQGDQVAQPESTEVAVMALAAGVTLLAVRRWEGRRLADATLAAGPLSVGVLVVLTLLAGAVDQWPNTSLVLTAIGLVLALEALAGRLPGATVSIATSVVVGLGLLAARAALDVEPATTVLGFGAATGWALYHRQTTTGGARRSYSVLAAVLPVGVALGVVSGFGWPWGLAATGTALLGVTVLARWWTRIDPLWSSWAAAASGVVAAGTPLAMLSALTWPGDADTAALETSWQTPVVALLAAATVTVGRVRPLGLQSWGVVAGVAEAWALLVVVRAGDLSWTTVGWAAGAAVLVLTIEAAGGRLGSRVAREHLAHGALAGLALTTLAASTAVAVSLPSWAIATVLGLTALAWAAVAVREDRGGSPAIDVLVSAVPELAIPIRSAPALVAPLVAALAAHYGVEATGRVDDAWWPVVTATCALAISAAGRATGQHLPRTTRMLHEAWLLVAAITVATVLVRLADDAPEGPTSLTLTLVLVGAVVTGTARDARDVWLGWAVTAPLTLLGAEQLGAGRDSWPQVLIAWGGSLVVAALAAERLPEEARISRLFGRTLPPAALGAAALTLGTLVLPFRADDMTVGWWYLAVGAVVLTATVLSRFGEIAGVAPLVLTVSFVTLAPWEPLDRPWTTVLWGAAWLLAVEGVRLLARHDWQRRAGTSTSIAVQIVLVLNLWYVVLNRGTAVGLALTGAVSLALAARTRGRIARWSYSVVGVLLVLLGAADAGPGWLALALTSLSVAASLVAWRATSLSPAERETARLVGAAAGTGAWWSLLQWSGWTIEVQVVITSAVAGLVVLALAGLGRLLAESRPWVGPWGLLVLVSLIGVSSTLPSEVVPRSPAGQWIALGYLLSAAAVGLSARPLGFGALRPTASVLLALSVAAYLYAVYATGPEVVAVGCTIALASLIASVGLTVRHRAEVWQPALLLATGGAELAALLAAAFELPRRDSLVVALLVLAAQCLGLGRARSITVLTLLGPPVLAVAWTLYASETLGGNPQWYAVPIGLSLVAVAGLLRWDRRQSGLPLATFYVVLPELAGLAIITFPTLVQMATDSLGYFLVALAEGALITLWGAVTKVRRRLAVGAGVIVAAVVLLITIPLYPLLPEWRGATLWITVAVLGLAAITVATMIERGRAKVHAWVDTLSSTMHDWE